MRRRGHPLDASERTTSPAWPSCPPGRGRRGGRTYLACVLLSGVLLSLVRADWDEYPDYPGGRVYLGNVAFLAGDYTEAYTRYNAATKQDPNYVVAWNNLGLAALHLGLLDLAETYLQKAKMVDPNYVPAHLNLGKCLAARKRFEEAEAVLKNGLGRDPNNPSLLYNLGWVHDEMGRLEDANDSYTNALHFDAKHYRARLARGIARAKLGRIPPAESDFYAVINGAGSQDVLRPLAAYNLQHMRGPGIDFHAAQAAQDFQEGVFACATEQYETAGTLLGKAEAVEPDVPEIPWTISRAAVGNRDPNAANASFVRARTLMERLIVDSEPRQAQVYTDGMYQGMTPRVVFVFPSRYDLTVRAREGNSSREWAGPAYTDGTLGMGDPSMCLKLKPAPNAPAFRPVEDADADGLTDEWEAGWLGHLAFTGKDDLPDGDSLSNLDEYWRSTDPTRPDSDKDGVTDADEIRLYGSDPDFANTFYYVNDTELAGDKWCTSIGDDNNDGKSPSSPKAGVPAVLAQYTIGPGSVICMDRGVYILHTNIELSPLVSGNSEASVILQGVGPETVLWRWGESAGSASFVLNHTSYVTVRSLRLTWGEDGMRLLETRHCRIDRCDLMDFKRTGISSTGPTIDTEIRNTLAVGGVYGFQFVDAFHPQDQWLEALRVRNCTLAENDRCAIRSENSIGLSVQDSILVTSGPGALCFQIDDWFPLTGAFDNNCYYFSDKATLAKVRGQAYPDLLSWQVEAGKPDNDAHSLSGNPLFAGAEDYHLLSTAGRLYQGHWVKDEKTSPCVDRGSIYAPYDREPLRNGGRINLGRYGGTEEASQSDR